MYFPQNWAWCRLWNFLNLVYFHKISGKEAKVTIVFYVLRKIDPSNLNNSFLTDLVPIVSSRNLFVSMLLCFSRCNCLCLILLFSCLDWYSWSSLIFKWYVVYYNGMINQIKIFIVILLINKQRQTNQWNAFQKIMLDGLFVMVQDDILLYFDVSRRLYQEGQCKPVFVGIGHAK